VNIVLRWTYSLQLGDTYEVISITLPPAILKVELEKLETGVDEKARGAMYGSREERGVRMSSGVALFKELRARRKAGDLN
jgi:hypothetical protein